MNIKPHLYFFLVVLLWLGCFPGANGQSVDVPLNRDYRHLIDRYEIKRQKFYPGLHTSVKPYQRSRVAGFADSIRTDSSFALSGVDRFNLRYLSDDNWEWSQLDSTKESNPLFGMFYRRKSAFYSHESKDLQLHANPVTGVGLSRESAGSLMPYTNSRGVQVRGLIDNKVGFYTYITDNQAIYPQHVRRRIDCTGVVPRQGFWKTFEKNGVDFINARGHIAFPVTSHIDVNFGYGKHFIGDGYRSLILSDFSSNYTYLRLNTNVWKLDYTNIFAEMVADVQAANNLFPKKYFALHHLSINVTDNFNLGVFESVVYGRENGGIDINYLNPVIFYRSIEQQLGSKDNALIGLNYKWNFLPGFSWYGQVVIDEFLLDHVKAMDGWWGNKHAFQSGLKYIDVAGISNWDMQVEANMVRPFVYTHNRLTSNYAHYRQPLAHPLGANFYELVGITRFQPFNRLSFTGKFIYAVQGKDSSGSNWGSNVLKDNITREQDFNNSIGQGVRTTLSFLDLRLTYQVYHNLFADLQQAFRVQQSPSGIFEQNNSYTSFALRWNIPHRNFDF